MLRDHREESKQETEELKNELFATRTDLAEEQSLTAASHQEIETLKQASTKAEKDLEDQKAAAADAKKQADETLRMLDAQMCKKSREDILAAEQFGIASQGLWEQSQTCQKSVNNVIRAASTPTNT